ncbi:YcxB family protein [Asanoa sp. NPDC049518]|uniref:YcxB family protein n=1 Tax=unclassified Asanoa TaxID=2685164 RepID=UPI003421EA58
MRIVIVATLDTRRPVAALRHVSRWVFRSFWAVGLLVLAVGLAGIVAVRGGDPALDAAVIVIGLLLLAAPSIMIASVRRQHRESAGMTIEYELDDDGLLRRWDGGESHVSWSDLVRAEIFKDTLLLFETRNQYIPIPIGDVSAADRADLTDFLASNQLWTPSDPARR